MHHSDLFTRLCINPLFCSCTMLMHFIAGTVNVHILYVAFFEKDAEDGLKYLCLFSFSKAFVYDIPISIRRPKIHLLHNPEDTIDYIANIIKWMPFAADIDKSGFTIRPLDSLQITSKSCLCIAYTSYYNLIYRL